jgi:S1-C subfamily serine protease
LGPFSIVVPHFEADGVYLPHADAGSSFSRVGIRERSGNSKVVIQEINGRAIRNLEDFIVACAEISGGQHTYVVVRDFNRFDSSPTPRSLTINLKFGQLDVFEWNESKVEDEALDWETVEE